MFMADILHIRHASYRIDTTQMHERKGMRTLGDTEMDGVDVVFGSLKADVFIFDCRLFCAISFCSAL